MKLFFCHKPAPACRLEINLASSSPKTLPAIPANTTRAEAFVKTDILNTTDCDVNHSFFYGLWLFWSA